MIETRYDIEYVDPPNSGKKKSAIGRFFLYNTLTLSLLVAIAALVFSNLPNGTSQLVIDKVKTFTSLIIEPQASPDSSPDDVVNSQLTATDEEKIKKEQVENQKADENELAKQQQLSMQKDEQYQQEIDLLTRENTEQHKHTIKLVEKNQTLETKIDKVSKQLEIERQNKSELLKKVSALQAKNKTASDLLEKTTKTNQSYASELEKIKQENAQKVVEDVAKPQEKIEKPTVKKVVEQTVEKKETEVNRNSAEKTQQAKQDDKKEKGKSQVDAIVAAMEEANGAQSGKTDDAQ